MMMMGDTIVRLPTVLARIGIGRSAIYDRIARGTWPRPVRITARAVGWPASEIDAMIDATVAGYDDDTIRRVVARIYETRARAGDRVGGTDDGR